MSQQAYIVQNRDGTYAAVSNGGQAIRVIPCESLDDVAKYILRSRRVPVRDLPPYFSNDSSDIKPITAYDFDVLKALVTEEESDEITGKDDSEGGSVFSRLSNAMPAALMTILGVK